MSFLEQIDNELAALEESSLSRLQRKVSDYESGAISGYRGENSPEVNKSNNREIKAYLMAKGYSVTAVKGSYIENFGSADQLEVSEPSFFVVDHKNTGRLEKDLVALGKRYDQDSILMVPKGGVGAYLVGTTNRDNSFLSMGQKSVVGNSRFGKVAGMFLSRVRNREFAFESVEIPDSIGGKRAMHLLAEHVEKELDFD